MSPNPHAVAQTDSSYGTNLQRLLTLLTSDPDNRRLRGDCVALALHHQDYSTAMQLAEAALARDAMDVQAKFERASALMGLRQFVVALEVLSELAQGPQIDPAVAQNMALCHYLLANHAAARPYLEALYAQGIRSADLLRLLISTLHHLGLLKEALVVAEGAAEFAKQDGALAGVLSLLYLDADQPAQAARWSVRALQSDAHSIDGLVVQGTLRAGAFELPTARQQFDQVLQRAPQTARAWVGLSMVSMAENDFSQARQQIQMGLKYMPQHVGSWHVLAWIELMQGQLDKAQAAFEQALSLDRNFAESHGGLAAIAALRGDRQTAEHLVEVAERLDPRCLSAKFARSTLMKGQGDAAGAKEALFTALSGISPKDNSAVSRIIAELTRK